jgi:hypothetical protein
VLSKEMQDLGNGRSLFKGTAELQVENITRNRTSLAAPFRFTFEYRSEANVRGALSSMTATSRFFI